MKIDVHRHLGGSITPECVWEMIQRRKYYYIAESLEEVRRSMTFSNGEPYSFKSFLDKFRILDEIKWDKELIDMTIYHVSQQIIQEEIDYCFMDFSINKYMQMSWHKWEAVKFIHDKFQEYCEGRIGLILSLKYESLRHIQEQHANLIYDDRAADLLVGIDLVGDESYFDAEFYKKILKPWKDSGKIVRAHVGESQTKQNIVDAIRHIGVTNIAHGIACRDDNDIIKMAIDNNVSFDMAISSNYMTGILGDRDYHPIIDIHEAGALVTIGADDPVQFSTTLDKEYDELCRIGGQYMVEPIYNNAIKVYDNLK